MLTVLKSHTSVRRYKDIPISDETFHELIAAAQQAATSNLVQAYSVIQVKDPQKKAALGELSNNAIQYSSAALSLLFCVDLHRLALATEKHGKKMHDHLMENFIVSTVDTALFAQNFVVAAESSGYGICYIGGVRNKPEEISSLFDLPKHVYPLFGMTVGVPDEQNEIKPRLASDAIVHVDTYDDSKYDKAFEAYDEVMKQYYNERTSNKKDTTWTEIMAEFMSKERRKHMKEFIISRGFLQK